MQSKESRESVVLTNENQKIFGVIHRPIDAKRTPAVLICHGLGGNKIGKQRLYVRFAEMLSQIGITAFRFDFRGSGDSEGEFSDMTLSSEISDAMKGLEFLKGDARIDSDQIGIFGRSFGGLVATLAAYQSQNIKSLVLWAPVFSGDQWKEQWKLVQKHAVSPEKTEELMKVEGMKLGKSFFEQLFQLKMQQEIQALSQVPMLHIHGEKDKVVDLSHAENYSNERKKAESESRFVRFPETDHDFSNMLERAQALELSQAWFQKTLKK